MILDHQGYPIVGDDYAPTGVHADHGTGYEGRDLDAFPLYGLKCARKASVQRLTETEIVERVIEYTAGQKFASDLADRAGLKRKNQKQSSYCWIHAPTSGMEYCIMLSGGKVVVLAAFYAGSQIKGGRNQGGSGIAGVKWLAEHGTCLESQWPPMQFKGENTPEIQAMAARRQITIYEEFDPADKQLIYSAILQLQPVTVGIPAWGHEVLLTFLTMAKPGSKDFGDIREGFDNSWGPEWGKNGRGVLEGAKRRFDEAGRIAGVEACAA